MQSISYRHRGVSGSGLGQKKGDYNRHDLGAALEASVQSFRILLTPLAYIPVGHIDIEICNSCGGRVESVALGI